MTQQKSEEPTIGKLVADASRDISSLVQKEIELAKREIKVSVTAGGIGAGLFAGAAFVMLLAIIIFSITVACFIHWAGLGWHWSFLIVFAFYVLLAAILALIGLKQVKKAKYVASNSKAVEQGKEIPKAVKPGKRKKV